MKKLLYIILLLPFIANAQVNGTIQKTASSGTIRGSFGSLGLDTIPMVTGALVNGYILKYHAATNKWYASPDPTIVGLQDSLTKKANRTFDNVASGAIANVKLANSTISGVALGSNLNALTLGNGLTGTSYNGSSAITARADTAVVQTVANFFPKGDTRYQRTSERTTVGNSFYTLTNPSAITFPRINANNTVSALSASDFRTAIGAGTSSTTGTVTSVAATVPTGLTISGSPVTTSGTLAFGLQSGYSIPTTAKQGQWDTAYGWGNPSGVYLPLTGGTLTGSLSGTSASFSGAGSFGGATYAAGGFYMGSSSSYIARFVSSGTFISLDAWDGSSMALPMRIQGSAVQLYGPLMSNQLIGSGNVIVYANNSGELGKMSIGSGLSFSGGILSATGGSAGTVTGSGTSGKIAVWNSASDIGDSPLTVTGSNVSASGTVTATSFSGAGTGLTGTASGLSIGGNAGTVTNGVYTTGDQSIGGVKTFNSTVVANIAGNAATATALQTARTINGVSFNGTANINIGTTVGQNFIGLTNPSAITFPRINANNTVSALSASDFRTAIGAGTSSTTGTVTSVSAGNGLNFTTITGSGSVTLGTPSSVTLASTNSVTTNSHTHAFAPGGTTAQYLRGDGSLATFPSIPAGTVTSVAASGGTGISISGSPITTSGTITITNTAPNATHTGDVTGSTALTIANSAVTLAKMANVATSTVFYRKTAGTGAPEVQTLATLKTDLGLSGTNTGDQTNITGNAGTVTNGVYTTGDQTIGGVKTFNSTVVANIAGNAGTATALQTARNIQGVSFNGTADINPINGTGFVKATGTTLSYDNSTYLTTSSASSTYAPLNSPALTGNPTAPTQTAGNNSTRIATTAFVNTALSNLDIASGTYTPTITDGTNVTSSTPKISSYTRVGDQVSVDVTIDITTTTPAASVLWVSLPIPSGIGPASSYLRGTGVVTAGFLNYASAIVDGNPDDGTATVHFISTSSGNQTLVLHFTYTVI